MDTGRLTDLQFGMGVVIKVESLIKADKKTDAAPRRATSSK